MSSRAVSPSLDPRAGPRPADDWRADAPVDPRVERAVERAVALAFAPMHKAAMGASVGLAGGVLVFLVTAVRLLVGPPEPTHLVLLAEFFAGYSESWAGALIGMAWGMGVGFVAGWFAAFVHNLVVAVWLLVIRARAQFSAAGEILDHI
jgi:hypothetical protein